MIVFSNQSDRAEHVPQTLMAMSSILVWACLNSRPTIFGPTVCRSSQCWADATPQRGQVKKGARNLGAISRVCGGARRPLDPVSLIFGWGRLGHELIKG